MTNEIIDVVITSREEQGLGVAILEFAPVSADSLPVFDAGAHIDVHIGSDFVRQYSLCSQPGVDQPYRVGVLKDPKSRGGSIGLHENFLPGQKVKISAPRNHFPLVSDAKHSILAGGGIGITPMIAMAYTLKSQGKSFEIHYCCRSEGVGAFEDELKSEFADQVHFHYDDGEKNQLFNPKEKFSPYMPDQHIYVCGPSGFMDWVIENTKLLSYPSSQVHFEYFSADVDTTGDAFEVYCAKSDLTVVIEETKTIAKTLIEAGIKVDLSCEEGICGTCITDVLEGEPDHRDQFLTDEEKEDNDQMALCCSRSKSKKLVLDI